MQMAHHTHQKTPPQRLVFIVAQDLLLLPPMARHSVVVLMILMIIFAAFASSTGARKLLEMKEERKQKKKRVPFIESSLIFSVLPKGDIPGSAPSDKGHASPDNRKLFARHLIRPKRIVHSVSSPSFSH